MNKVNFMNFLARYKHISRRTKILTILSILLLVIGWQGYQKYQEKRLTAYRNYLEAGRDDFDAKDYDKAIFDFTGAINNSPRSEIALVYALRAYSYYFKDDFDKVLADTDMVLKYSKDTPPELFNLRGDAYRYSKRYDEATTEYGKAYDLSSGDRDTVHNYAGGLLATKQWDRAYEVISKYFKDTPKEDYWEDTDVWYDRAFAALEVHRCMEASTSAWHLLMRTTDEGQKTVGEGVMHNALNDKECIDKDTFAKDAK